MLQKVLFCRNEQFKLFSDFAQILLLFHEKYSTGQFVSVFIANNCYFFSFFVNFII